MATRDLGAAKEAWARGSVEQSKLVHQGVVVANEQHRTEVGEVLKSCVFAGLDGLVTTFAVLVSAVSLQLSHRALLIVTFSNLFADAVGMAIADYLSSRAEDHMANVHRLRLNREYDEDPEALKVQLAQAYMGHGLDRDDAREVAEIFYENKDTFLNTLLLETEGVMPEEAGSSSFKNAIVTFIAFLIFGGLPMLSYVFSGDYGRVASTGVEFWVSIALFAASLLVLGVLKGYVSNSSMPLNGAFLMLTGGITTVVAYYVGDGFGKI